MKTRLTFGTNLGADRHIKNFRRFKKALSKMIIINPSELNLLRRKKIIMYKAGKRVEINILGFIHTYPKSKYDTHELITFAYSSNQMYNGKKYVDCSMPSDYRMKQGYESRNHLEKV